jgi:two-component system alkaline phosphatase synthesis response regulator PhoP
MSQEVIFAVDDEANILELIKYNLEDNGFRVKGFDNGDKLLNEINRNLFPDLFILDIMLPGQDGLELCRQLRQDMRTRNIPIIMLTAKGEEIDKVIGLELGADDYITKPFGVRELVARVRALLRRTVDTNTSERHVLKYGQIFIDCDRREVYRNWELIDLTYKEFELLKMLVINKGKVLTREALLESIWGFDYTGETRTVDVHIRYLRQKLEDDSDTPMYIETIRGVGYRFIDNRKYGDGER